jgi:hypothetical protein
MVNRVPFKWNTANFAPNQNPFPNQSKIPFTWNDVALLIEIISGGPGGIAQTFQDKEKKKRFITLWCKVKGYDETKQTKEVKNVKITAHDVEMVIKEILGINVKIDL